MKKSKTYIPFHKPTIGQEEIKALRKVLESGWLTTGPQTVAFEKEFIQYTQSKYSVALNSCTAALGLSLAAAGIKQGDEVVLPSFTFPATAAEIIHLGAIPVFADIDPEVFNVTSESIQKKITSRTKAIIPTHFGGHPCDLRPLIRLANKNHLLIIEDAAHALGSLYEGKPIGSSKTFAACYSFYATKNITTAEGGMLTTQSKSTEKKVRILSLHGIKKDAWKRYSDAGNWFYEVVEPGYKSNLSDIQSALGRVQLEKLNRMNQKRCHIASLYDKYLSDIEEIQTPQTHPYATRNGHLYTITGKTWTFSQRNKIIQYLKDWNIGASVHFIPTHLHPYYRNRFGNLSHELPVTESVYHRIISLPIYPELDKESIKYISEVLKNALAATKKK